jgi:hypothetical protein
MRRITLQALVELARVGQRLDLKSLLAQVAREEIAQASVIVDDKYLGTALLHGAIVGFPTAATAPGCHEL